MQDKRIEFKNRDGLKLSANLSLPVNGKIRAYALFAHCFTCNKNLKAIHNIKDALNTKGYALLRFDFTGLGESGGDFSETNFSSNVEDLIDAANFLAQSYEAPRLIIGHSLGGAAAILAASQIPSIEAVCTIAAPSDPTHVQHLIQDQIEEIKANGKANVKLAGRTFTIKEQFLHDLENHKVESILKDLKKPLLILHSPQDNTVGIENAARIYDEAMHPKSFISLDGADHLLTNQSDSLYVGEVIASWSSRYISFKKEKPLKSDHQVVAALKNEGMRTLLQAGEHGLIADEPEDVGGSNAGPSPYELVSAGLASCTALTLQLYARRKEWPLEEVQVHVDYNKKHCDDCVELDKDSKIDTFSRRIQLSGELNAEQKERLLQIANKCPVHKTLEAKAEVKTEYLEKDV